MDFFWQIMRYLLLLGNGNLNKQKISGVKYKYQ